MKIGGLIGYDNTLWNGSVAQPADAPMRKYVRYYRDFVIELNKALAADPRIEICMLPVGDGVTLCRRISWLSNWNSTNCFPIVLRGGILLLWLYLPVFLVEFAMCIIDNEYIHNYCRYDLDFISLICIYVCFYRYNKSNDKIRIQYTKFSSSCLLRFSHASKPLVSAWSWWLGSNYYIPEAKHEYQFTKSYYYNCSFDDCRIHAKFDFNFC